MTSQKHLKSAVRARMVRTGERYTTARRDLVGEPPQARADVAPGYDTLGGGRHHDSGLLTHVLAAAGVVAAHDGEPLDEPMVAGLAGGIGFMYFSFSYAGQVPTMTIVPAHPPAPVPARRAGTQRHPAPAGRDHQPGQGGPRTRLGARGRPRPHLHGRPGGARLLPRRGPVRRL